jgi:hypothetical protein
VSQTLSLSMVPNTVSVPNIVSLYKSDMCGTHVTLTVSVPNIVSLYKSDMCGTHVTLTVSVPNIVSLYKSDMCGTHVTWGGRSPPTSVAFSLASFVVESPSSKSDYRQTDTKRFRLALSHRY